MILSIYRYRPVIAPLPPRYRPVTARYRFWASVTDRYRFSFNVTLPLPYRYLTVTLPLPYRYLTVTLPLLTVTHRYSPLTLRSYCL
jgi:hypothetical protein